MINLPILYSFRRCPYAIRARLALAYAGQHVIIREVKLSAKPAELLQLSPKGTVPVLHWQGGVIDESLDIIRWALDRLPTQTWLSNDVSDQLALVKANDTTFKQNLDKYKYADRHPEFSQEQYRQKCLAFVAALETRLQNAPYLWGAHATLADYAILPFIRQFAMVDSKWFATQPHCPQVRTWLQRMLHDPLFGLAMAKYPVWQRGAEDVLWP